MNCVLPGIWNRNPDHCGETVNVALSHVYKETLSKQLNYSSHLQVPKLETHDGNSTITTMQILTQIEGGLIVLPMIGFLESIAIAKAFARKNKYKVDPSQELIALGLANFIGSFCSAYPVTGSFSRTAVNSISGVATPLGGKCDLFCFGSLRAG